MSRLGAEISYVGSRGYNLPIFMEVNPGVFTRARRRRARASAGVRAVAPNISGRQVVVRFAADQPAPAADARPQFLASYHAWQDN